MKRLLVFLTVAAVLAPASAHAGIVKKNKIAHWKHYTTCHTCPRAPMAGTIDYGPDGKLNHRLWKAAAANPFGWYILYVWESGSIYYKNGKCTSKPHWNDGYHIYDQLWNKYQFEGADAPVKGSGPGYRYRRRTFHFYAGWKDILSKHADKYVGMTLRCDGTWQPAG